jgi:uncharacterized protein YjbI with pentapeptide repeats
MMLSRRRSWWQKIPSSLLAGIIVLVAAMILIWAAYRFQWDWTGFTQPAKTLWDWLQLLGVLAIPVAVVLGTAWFTTKQGQVSDAEHKDNQHEAALQAYIDTMSELLLAKNLRGSTEDEEVQRIARVRTLTVLRRLDAERKGSVLQFLHESGLIGKDNRIIHLTGANLILADLSGVNLSFANLSGANLSFADLGGANLSGADLRAILSFANLSFANLSGADLSFADLGGAILILADLSGANLSGTLVTTEQLTTTKSLQGVTMPDGSKHP